MVPKELGEELLKVATVWTPENTEQYHIVREKLVSGQLCEYCGATARTFDHIIPKSKGGQESWKNLAYVCSSCNASKSNKLLLEWIDHCNRMLRTAVRKEQPTEIWLRRLHGITGLILESR